MRCDRCQGPTKPKQITSKNNGKEYTILECTNGCKNGKYNYSFFPPKEEKQISQKPASSNEAVQILRAISGSLKNIERILSKESGIERNEPDEQVAPF